jgi:hypothetical protein
MATARCSDGGGVSGDATADLRQRLGDAAV